MSSTKTHKNNISSLDANINNRESTIQFTMKSAYSGCYTKFGTTSSKSNDAIRDYIIAEILSYSITSKTSISQYRELAESLQQKSDLELHNLRVEKFFSPSGPYVKHQKKLGTNETIIINKLVYHNKSLAIFYSKKDLDGSVTEQGPTILDLNEWSSSSDPTLDDIITIYTSKFESASSRNTKRINRQILNLLTIIKNNNISF